LTGSIHLQSNITLHLDAGAVLKFSQDFDDYLPMVKSRWEGTECTNFSPPIHAYRAENIAIVGRGLIDGQRKDSQRILVQANEPDPATGAVKRDEDVPASALIPR
jgi:polygalacturonase